MRLHGARMSKIIEIEKQWRPRRNKRNRNWREGQRKMRVLSTKIIKLMEDDDDTNGRHSPCSVISLSLSLDNAIEGTHESSEWIRTAHIKNPPLDEQDRRSPLFTERLRRRNNFADEIGYSRRELSPEFSSNLGHNGNPPRLSIRDRLEPAKVPRDIDIDPHLESSHAGGHHQLGSPDINIERRMGPPGAQVPYREGNPTFIRDEYDDRNVFGPPLGRPRRFRRSLYYPPGYSNPPNESQPRRQASRWPWLPLPEESPRYSEQYARRDDVDYNADGFTRDGFFPMRERRYDQPEYSRSRYFDATGNNLRESRSEMSLPTHQVDNYRSYGAESFENNYEGRRDDGRLEWSLPQSERRPNDFYSPRGFYGSRSPPYSSAPASSHPPHDAFLNTHRYKSLLDPPLSSWEGPPRGNFQFSYQNSISDEDFPDSDSEAEDSEDTPKKRERQMWKQLVKERGVLVYRDADSAEMTRECAHHVKKVLLEKATCSVKLEEKWKPRFLRTGLVHSTGLYQIICQDYQTVTWTLKQEIPPLEGQGFKFLKRPYDWDCGGARISMWVSSEPPNPQEALQCLDAENPGIRAVTWRLASVSVESGWRKLVADISRESAIYLETNGWTLRYWNNILPVNRLRTPSNQPPGNNV